MYLPETYLLTKECGSKTNLILCLRKIGRNIMDELSKCSMLIDGVYSNIKVT
jgi:hypothetical protein